MTQVHMFTQTERLDEESHSKHNHKKSKKPKPKNTEEIAKVVKETEEMMFQDMQNYMKQLQVLQSIHVTQQERYSQQMEERLNKLLQNK